MTNVRIFMSALIFWILSISAGCLAQSLPSIGNSTYEAYDQRSAMIKMMAGKPNQSNEYEGDNFIDTSRYFVGPGDVFMASVPNSQLMRFTGTVNLNWDIVFSQLGVTHLGNIPLSIAKKQIRDFVGSKVEHHGDVYVVLDAVKSATVTVLGATPTPGTYQLRGTGTVLDAIRLAFNNQLPSVNDCNLREVRCTIGDSVFTLDLYRFLTTGDKTQNPYVFPGEQIQVIYTQRKVSITGLSHNVVNGEIPICKDETLASFLSLFMYEDVSDTSYVYYKKADKEQTSKVYSSQYAQTILSDRDMITIPHKDNYPNTQVVIVEGEVVRQGDYPVTINKTTVQDVLTLAGGKTEYANMAKVAIIRLAKNLPPEANGNIRPEILAAYKKTSIGNDFRVINLATHGMNVVVQPGDIVVFPRLENFVYLSGNVKKPGAYEFIKGKDYRYYVGAAGGYAQRADKANIFVVSQYRGAMQFKDKTDLQDGDVLVVPESQQDKFLLTILLPLISTVATVVSVSLAIYNATR
jgi:protein involved in polysaccharide export with SLBB domain